MKRKVYETPVTKRTAVELEQGFMQSSLHGEKIEEIKSVDAGDQEIEGNHDFTENPWK